MLSQVCIIFKVSHNLLCQQMAARHKLAVGVIRWLMEQNAHRLTQAKLREEAALGFSMMEMKSAVDQTIDSRHIWSNPASNLVTPLANDLASRQRIGAKTTTAGLTATYEQALLVMSLLQVKQIPTCLITTQEGFHCTNG